VQLTTSRTWALNDTPLNLSNSDKYSISADGTQLTVRDLQFSDEGNYTCVFMQDEQQFVSPGNILRIVGKGRGRERGWED
jgi:hypothetical protein